MKRITPILALFAAFSAALCSCSTTKVLQEGESRLASNSVVITNDKKFNSGKIEQYISQKPNTYFIFGWNPFLNVYNWSNGKGKVWDKFVQKIGVAPVVFNPSAVESTINNIGEHLEYLGYYGSKVESEVTIKKKKAKVTYLVTLGKQYPISRIDYVLPDGELAQEFLADTANVTIRPGMMLSEEKLESETVRASRILRDKGFYDFSKNHFLFEADTLSTPGCAILEYRINEYTRNESPKNAAPLEKYTIGDITISHPSSLRIRENVLKNLNTLTPGALYRETDVNTTYSRLSGLKVFSSVNIATAKSANRTVDFDINVSPSKLQGFKINLEASVNSTGLFGISPQISYYNKNIFRGGEWLNLSFMGNFQFKFRDVIRSNEFGVSAGLSFPKFIFLPYRLFPGPNMPRTELNISYNYQDRPEYKRNIISTSFGLNGNVRNRFYYQFYPIQLNIVRLFNLDPTFYSSLSNDPFMRNSYQDHFDFGAGTTLYYTTSTEVVPKESSFYAKLSLDIAGNLLSAFKPLMTKDEDGAGIIWNTPFSQYVRAEATIGKTWRFGRNNGQAFAVRLLAGAGYAYGNSSALPFEKHFYAGGANSLRGWQARIVGPGLEPKDSSFIIPNQTGDMKLEANLEYRFRLFWKLEGALFWDMGNVWTLKETALDDPERSPVFNFKDFGKSIAANWGVGLRVDLNFLLLRLDLGLKVHDPSKTESWIPALQWFRKDNFSIHFGVGYPF
ncbi:MAG: BamA/TamA family outer membrane protein [Candidatus Cryptobacteroides sp.]